MPQQQQQTKLRPVQPMPITKAKKPSDFPGMDSPFYNSPAMNKKFGDKPRKSKAKTSKSKTKKAVKTPSFAKVQKSVRKTMGY